MAKTDTFVYDVNKDCWTQCDSPELCTADSTTLPIIVVCHHYDEHSGEYTKKAWCPAHHAYEKIVKASNGGLLTETGCHLEGLIFFDKNSGWFPPYTDREETICWQVGPVSPGTIRVTSDTARFVFQWVKSKAGSFVYAPSIQPIRHKEMTLSLHDKKQPDRLPYMPAAVVHAAITALQGMDKSCDNCQAIHTIKKLRECMEAEKYSQERIDYSPYLLAYLQRPLDMQIWFYRQYFDASDFEQCFAAAKEDNFPALCTSLGITPTNTLRHAYENSPAAFLLISRMQELCIEQDNLKERFVKLRNFLGDDAYSPYRTRILKPVRKPDGTDSIPSPLWEALCFYCKWRRGYESEEALTSHLLALNANWKPWMETVLLYFQKYYAIIPQTIKDSIFQAGPTVSIHDNLAVIVHDQNMMEPDRSYGEKDKALECNINGYNFRLVSSLSVFRQIFSLWNLNFRHLIQQYADRDSVLISIDHNGVYCGMAIVNDETVKMFQKSISMDNAIRSANIQLAYAKWLLHTGLKESADNDNYKPNEFKDILWKIPVNPVEKDSVYEPLGLQSLLDLPDDNVHPGYYLYLFRRFMETNILHPDPPTIKDDEYEYLQEHFPLGTRIYKEAWAGNPEAQFVMSLMYDEDSTRFWLKSSPRSIAWLKKANESGWHTPERNIRYN